MENISSYLIYGMVALGAIIIGVLLLPSKGGKKKKSVYEFVLETTKRKIIFYNPFANFLVYGGAGSGKTKSIGKNILREYIRHDFAGFIYDYKDFDLTQTALHLTKKYNYSRKFYFISFVDMEKTYRVNPIKPSVVEDENLFLQLMEDLLSAYQEGEKDTWFMGALGILKGVSIRFFKEYPDICTIPHIVNYICFAGAKNIHSFLEGSYESRTLGAAFLDAKKSEKTQASYLSTLTNCLSSLAFNKNICYVLSGDDFDFNLIDPEEPKLVAVANAYQIEGVISPVIGLMLSISSRKFTLRNKIPFMYFLDEATTFKISDFEKLPSVLREYKCSFTLITQSSAKIEKRYGKLDRSSIEANFSNQFYGRTKDTEALKTYPLVFGKIEKEKISKSKGASSGGNNQSTTVSLQKEEKYDSSFFTKLKAGEFVGSAADATVSDFNASFKMYDDKEEPLEIVKAILPQDIEQNFNEIKKAVLNLCENQ